MHSMTNFPWNRQKLYKFYAAMAKQWNDIFLSPGVDVTRFFPTDIQNTMTKAIFAVLVCTPDGHPVRRTMYARTSALSVSHVGSQTAEIKTDYCSESVAKNVSRLKM